MSNLRAERRRQQRAEAKRHGHDPDVCITVGFWPERELEEAKRATHDNVVEQLGARRRSGVRWFITRGDEAMAFLDRMMEGADEAQRAYYRRLRACVRDSDDGVVVAATAEGVRT